MQTLLHEHTPTRRQLYIHATMRSNKRTHAIRHMHPCMQVIAKNHLRTCTHTGTNTHPYVHVHATHRSRASTHACTYMMYQCISAHTLTHAFTCMHPWVGVHEPLRKRVRYAPMHRSYLLVRSQLHMLAQKCNIDMHACMHAPAIKLTHAMRNLIHTYASADGVPFPWRWSFGLRGHALLVHSNLE